MSSRALKRLELAELRMQQKESELDGDSSFSEDDKPITPRICQRNIYELLNEEDPSEDEDNGNSEQPEADPDADRVAEAETDAVVNKVAKSKKKKRKQKRENKHAAAGKFNEEQKKTRKGFHNISARDDAKRNASISSAANKSDEACCSVPAPGSIRKELIAVELRHLNQKNEMRRTFGKNLVAEMDKKKRNRQNAGIKSTLMVIAKPLWPPLEKNHITMKLLAVNNNNNSIKWFAFQHNEAYYKLQNLFMAATDRLDFNFLAEMVNRYYHLYALMYMSELCKVDEDYSAASEFIERALLAMESGLHPNFSYTNGNCRLSYRCRENRTFFLLLFKHAQHLESRACCRTALEVTKLILNLNPEEDPLATVLVLDYYALRCNAYKWLITFYEELSISRQLCDLPNMVYSYALALFLSGGENEKANSALQNAILTFPGVLRPLLSEMSVQIDKRVANHPYLRAGISISQSAALHQLACLYVCRAKYVWRASKTIKWLEKNTHIALNTIDNDSSLIKFYNDKRIYRYIQSPIEVLRHIILSDFRNKVPFLPFIRNEMTPIFLYDPLPPPDADDANDSKSLTNAEHRHPFSVFFRSLFPSFNTSAEPAGSFQPADILRGAIPEVDDIGRRLERLNNNLGHAEGAVVGAQNTNFRMAEEQLAPDDGNID